MVALWSNESVSLGQDLAYVMAIMYSERGVQKRTTQLHSELHSAMYDLLSDKSHDRIAPKSLELIATPADMSVWQGDSALLDNPIYVAFKGDEVLFVAGRLDASYESKGIFSLLEFKDGQPARYVLRTDVAEEWPDPISIGEQQIMRIGELVQQLEYKGHTERADSLKWCVPYLTPNLVE
jgi:hypothetical protein|tara:strand:- start:831 stop:1370 length:540 start_codon:yes stop_codon:yes gene_type:complete